MSRYVNLDLNINLAAVRMWPLLSEHNWLYLPLRDLYVCLYVKLVESTMNPIDIYINGTRTSSAHHYVKVTILRETCCLMNRMAISIWCLVSKQVDCLKLPNCVFSSLICTDFFVITALCLFLTSAFMWDFMYFGDGNGTICHLGEMN